jgi:tetratricopeptide (TPR) repeat protein
MGRRSIEQRYETLRRLADGPYPALTVRYGRRFLAKYPDLWVAWIKVGAALVSLARYEEAEQALAKALEHCPEGARQFPLSEMGHLFLEAGDYDQAASWYRRAIDAAPEKASPRIYLGAVLAKQGRFQEAEEAHQAAIGCPSGCIAEAHLNRGLVLRALERFREAAECFRETLRLDPDSRLAREALRDVERCIRLG